MDLVIIIPAPPQFSPIDLRVLALFDLKRRSLIREARDLRAQFLRRCGHAMSVRVNELYMRLCSADAEPGRDTGGVASWFGCAYYASENFEEVDETWIEYLIKRYLDLCEYVEPVEAGLLEYEASEFYEWLCDMKDEDDRLQAAIMLAAVAPDEDTMRRLQSILQDPMYTEQ